MKTKKIRNYKQILNQIDDWRSQIIDLDIDVVRANQRDYAKIWVSPYSNLSLGNSAYPEPKGQTRKAILKVLLDTYDSWKETLDTMDEPYYLKIWLFDQRFSQSQVVCGIKSFLDFYEDTFYKPENKRTIDPSDYGALGERIQALDWEYAWDEEHFDNTSIGEIDEYASEKDFYEMRRWFKDRLQKPHRRSEYSDPDSDITEYYSFRRGTVWIGG